MKHIFVAALAICALSALTAFGQEPQELQEPSSELTISSDEPQVSPYDQSAPSDDPQVSSDDQPIPSDDPQALSDDQPIPSDDPQVSSDDQPTPSDDPQVSSDDQPTPSDDPQVSSDDQPTPSDDSQVSSDDQPTPSDDPQVFSDEPSLPFDEPYAVTDEFQELPDPETQHGFQVEQEQEQEPEAELLAEEQRPEEEEEELKQVLAESQRHGRVKIGVMWLESATGHDKEAREMTELLLTKLDDFGLYEIYAPKDLDVALRDMRVRIPSECRSDRCVGDIGKALNFRRMIYGSVDMTGTKYAVQLTLLNVATSRPIETISIEGAPDMPAEDVLRIALNRLHGYPMEGDVTKYYGTQVNNLSEFLWSTLAVQGAGMLYSIVNYVIGSDLDSDNIAYGPGGPYNGNDRLSGIPAASNQIPIFARPAALANAYTAVSDDAYGVLYNPAGMAWLRQRDAVAAYQHRFGMDLLAFSYANRATRDMGFGQALLLATDRDGAMTELFFVTAVGYKINQKILFGPVSVGASVKFMGNTVRALSEDSPQGQAYGAGLDIGFMWELSREIRYGIMLRDFPSVNQWKNRTTGSRYSEALPPTLHMGGSYRAGYSTFLTADGQIPLYGDQPWLMAGGIEYEFFRILALRIGLQREILNEEANWWKITCGTGIRIDTRAQWGREMELDIAYEYNTLRQFPVLNVAIKVGF
ncbi:MAG: hypothetical protein LBU70_08480 [Chitinispirillales bacterium]|nr:hypothetical protein [Chitinispirillales bacterium]